MSDLQWDRAFAFEQAGEDEELLAELLDLLSDSSAGDVAKIKEAMAAGDVGAMGDAAHSIKGAAASLGVAALRDAAYALEKAGREGKMALAKDCVPPLETLVAQLGILK